MFIYSVKTSKTKIAAVILAIIVAAAAIIMTVAKKEAQPTNDDSLISYMAEDAAQRTAFLSQFGWQISDDPIEVSEVIIPAEFDTGYTQYNEMQKAQGLDLEPYKGLRAKRWTYDVLNYPGYEGKSGFVQANLIVYEGRIIGGDICSLEQGGFMQGFDFPEINQTPTTSAATTQAQTAN